MFWRPKLFDTLYDSASEWEGGYGYSQGVCKRSWFSVARGTDKVGGRSFLFVCFLFIDYKIGFSVVNNFKTNT